MEHSGTKCCQIQHLIVSDLLELAGCRNFTRICCIYAVYVSVDLAGICMECRCQSNCCRIGAASSKRCIIIVFIDSLETCHNNDLVVFQFSLDPFGINSLESCISVNACGMHCNLECVQRNGWNSQFIECHGHQCHGHLLSDRKKHIHLTLRRFLIDILCHGDEFICVFTHCRKNYHHIIAFFVFFYASSGDIKDTLFVCN